MRLIALLCFFTSFIASANSYQFLTSRGVDTLDGPSVIECPNKGTAELLDFYEWEWNGLGLKDGPTSSAEEKISELTARLIVLDPRRANQLDKRAKEIVKEVVFHQDVDFGPVEGPGDVGLPEGCGLRKIASVNSSALPGQKKYHFSKRLWELLGRTRPLGQAGLLLHLAVEEEAKLYGHKDARKSRYYTGLLASEMLTLSSFKFEQYLERFLFVNIPSYYYLDFRLDLSQKITFHPNGFPATALAAENNTKARVGINELVFVRPGVATLEFHSTGGLKSADGAISQIVRIGSFAVTARPGRIAFYPSGKIKTLPIEDSSTGFNAIIQGRTVVCRTDSSADTEFFENGQIVAATLAKNVKLRTSAGEFWFPDGKKLTFSNDGYAQIDNIFPWPPAQAGFTAGKGFVHQPVAGFLSRPKAIQADDDGNLLVLSEERTQKPVNNQYQIKYVLRRYSREGLLDATFGNSGMILITQHLGYRQDIRDKIFIHPDKKIGIFTGQPAQIFKLLPNGERDQNFGMNGAVSTLGFWTQHDSDFLATMMILSKSKYIVGGNSSRSGAIRCLNSDGTVDASFGSAGDVYFGSAHFGGYLSAIGPLSGNQFMTATLEDYSGQSTLQISQVSSTPPSSPVAIGSHPWLAYILRHAGTWLFPDYGGIYVFTNFMRGPEYRPHALLQGSDGKEVPSFMSNFKASLPALFPEGASDTVIAGASTHGRNFVLTTLENWKKGMETSYGLGFALKRDGSLDTNYAQKGFIPRPNILGKTLIFNHSVELDGDLFLAGYISEEDDMHHDLNSDLVLLRLSNQGMPH